MAGPEQPTRLDSAFGPMSAHHAHDGESTVSNRELGAVLSEVVDALPDDLRSVFTLRMVEGLDTGETARCLDLTDANVKVRLHRARRMLQEAIDQRVGREVREMHMFNGARCDELVRRVLERVASAHGPPGRGRLLRP